MFACASPPTEPGPPGFDCPPASRIEPLESGSLRELACLDAEGKRSGPAATFGESGGLKSLGEFAANEPEGFFVLWGEPAASVIHFTARSGVPDGEWREFDASGHIAALLRFRSGQLEGPATWFYASGQPRIEGQHTDGEMEGRWREWFEDGSRKSECHYRRGQLDGLCRRWDASGLLRAEGSYEMGKDAPGFRYWNAEGELLESP